jgi:predicted Zn-dependent protease
MLRALQANDELTSRARGQDQAGAAPAWARTHPLTADRVSRAVQRARETGIAPGARPENEDAFLAAINGMTFGDDPRQGFVMGRRFAHPELGIGFEAPAGFALANSPRAVKIQGQGGYAGEFAAGRLEGSLEDYAYQVLRRLTGQAPVQAGRPERTRINGFEAVVLPARAQAQSGVVDVTVAAYAADGNRAYHFVTLAPAGRGGAFDPLFGSFHRLTPREAADLRPRRIEVTTVKPGDTVQSLAARMAVDELRTERFLAMNDLAPDAVLRPGRRVKLVSYRR